MTIPRILRLSTCRATCSCRAVFEYPELGDFAYGSFVFFGTEGTAFAHFDALGSEISKVVGDVLGSSCSAETFQGVCARLADPVKGQQLVPNHVCPSCRSSSWESWGGDCVGWMDVPEVTHVAFLSLHHDERRRRIRELGNVPAVAG
jgi:hypothetical protein